MRVERTINQSPNHGGEETGIRRRAPRPESTVVFVLNDTIEG